MKRSDILYAILIIAVTGGVLWYLLREPDRNRLPGTRGFGPARESGPWTPSQERTAEANEGFAVPFARENLSPAAGQSIGANWTQFNGARRDNKSSETGLLKSWPKEGPPRAWTATGLGVGFSTVAVVDGVVYTLGNKGTSEAIMAVDAGTGAKIWSTPFAWSSMPSMGAGPRGTPSVSGGSVFGMGAGGDLVCVDAQTGAIRWQKNIMTEYGGNVPGWGVCESVLVDANRVICTPGGSKATIVSLDAATGNELWKSLLPEKDGAGYASPLAANIGGIRQYIQFTARGTVSVRADNGEFLWRDDGGANGTANCSSALVSDNFVFSASNYGTGGALVRISASGSTLAAKQVYRTNDMRSHHGDMVIVDGLLYGTDDPGILTCLDLETGKPKWRDRSIGKGAVTYADGRIYLRSENGTVALVEATGEKYQELGKFDEPDRSKSHTWSHPVVAAGKLFLRDQGQLHAYDVKE